MSHSDKRTYIGVLASRDADRPNEKLIEIFNKIFTEKHSQLFKEKFHFIFTGGTYDRVLNGKNGKNGKNDENDEKGTTLYPGVKEEVKQWLETCSTKLPTAQQGGVIILSYLVCQHKCSIIWMFFEPNTIHWQRQENLALMRLCDQWHVKKLINPASVNMWLKYERERDADCNLQPERPKLTFRKRKQDQGQNEMTFDNLLEQLTKDSENLPEQVTKVSENQRNGKYLKCMTIALIAHDAMKERMIDFAIDHEAELNKFKSIITTRTTGNKIAEVTDLLENKITKCLTGPKGGDIEIATEIICNRCDVVIFFIDPLNPHPHIEDIRVVSEACMINDHTIIATNEAHARDFMFRIVRENNDDKLIY